MGEVNEEKCQMIESFYKQYGWNSWDRGSDLGTWHILLKGEAVNFELFVRVTEWWVFLTVNPLALGPKDPAMRNKLYQHLLHLNYDVTVAKYSLNKEGDVVLTVELPCDSPESFQYGEMEDAINLIYNNHSKHYIEILRLCTEANAPSAYLDGGDVDLS